MSMAFAVRSLARPYFAFRQSSLAGMSQENLYFGLAEVVLEFTLYATPETLSSADEIHALFSFHEQGPVGQTLLDIGVSPDGGVRAVNINGTIIETAPGRVFPNGDWHRVVVAYDGGTGAFILTLDDAAPVTASDGGGYLYPALGRVGEIMLFNNNAATARLDAAIRAVSVLATDGTPRTISWPIDERGDTLVGAKSAGDYAAIDPTLVAVYHDPILSPMYGVVPTESPGAAYRWEVLTEWSEETFNETVWTEEVAGA